jgi:hypothetical protein
VSGAIDVTSVDDFRSALVTLRGRTHGDMLAIYLALKKHQQSLPTIGDIRQGFPSGYLETLLDGFYTKRHSALGKDNGKVCHIFGSSRASQFTPQSSYRQNNWRDAFRYANGVGCLAPENEFTSDFLAQHRSQCKYLVHRSDGACGCRLHPKQTKYIRGLGKPKYLKWTLLGPARGEYKLVDLDDVALVEYIRPLGRDVHLESLIVAVYFGATWNSKSQITIEQFVADFNFESEDQVELLFSTELDDRLIRPEIETAKKQLIAKLSQPFKVFVVHPQKSVSIKQRNVRERAFAEAVREAYGDSCAVCGLKLQAVGGQVEVQAAHIIDRAKGGDDDLRNGIALCRRHHWIFDHDGFTIDSNWKIVCDPAAVGPSIFKAMPPPGQLIRLPSGSTTWPAPAALDWHRKKTFAAWAAPQKTKARRKAQPPLSFP